MNTFFFKKLPTETKFPKAAGALVFGLALVVAATALVSCDDGSDDSGSSFDGSTIAGTSWVAETDLDLSSYEMGKGTIKGTLSFSSDTAGTIKAEVTDWGTITDSAKALVNASLGTFTLSNVTYNAAAKTGAYGYAVTGIGATSATFTVDVSAKTLTAEENDGEDTETIVYKLK